MVRLKAIADCPVDAAATPPEDQLTPALRQYVEQKRQVGDALLLLRMGDFYELFFDDARRASDLLGIALTTRDGATPMAGIPYHALESYLRRLVSAGCRVAISEQVDDPRSTKGLLRREIVRIVTPGTLTDDGLLERTAANVLAAVCVDGDQAGLATLELCSGLLMVSLWPADRLIDELHRAAPAELLVVDGPDMPLNPAALPEPRPAITPRPAADFGVARSMALLCEQFQTRSLEGFGFEAVDASLRAAGALVAYVRETQRSAADHLRPPLRRASGDTMALDATTLRSLEVERTLRSGRREGSLWEAVDGTVNPMGTRMLRRWLCYPSRDLRRIAKRQSAVAAFVSDEESREALREHLRALGDLERIIGRIGVRRAHPRDLRALGEGLQRLRAGREIVSRLAQTAASEHLERCAAGWDGLDDLADDLCGALRPDPPVSIREGGIFAAGYDAELDRLRSLSQEHERWLSEFQAAEAERLGIANLKVGYNRVFGFYIEVTHAHRSRVPAEYIRRQTVKNAERYVTEALRRHEAESLAAQARANDLEFELFDRLRTAVAGRIRELQRAADSVAEVDVLAGWAALAASRGYVRPEFFDQRVLEIRDGRHPVVHLAVGPAFVGNDLTLDGGRANLALITGPNMAGKSTYIRQAALLALLAHCGAWVPAKSMRLGPLDRIFTRVGAADELARGQSTFMVEMLETANILHNASRDSLVILDEVGRGTSTFDGLSLAWAVTEHLARLGCRALFATHYHELTELAQLTPGVFNLNVAVRECDDQVLFLHKVVPGAADRSYGLHVARLAGIPTSAIQRAAELLSELERRFQRDAHRPALAAVQRRRQRQLRLFEPQEDRVLDAIRQLNPDQLTADAALAAIRQWCADLAREPECV